MLPFKLIQGNPASLAYFLNDCIISAATDFIIASVFAVRFFQHGKGFIVMAVYTLLLAINVMFFINVKLVQNQMQCNETSGTRLNDIMKPDDEAIDMFEMIPRIRSSTHLNETRNYCYELVFHEINSVYDDSPSNDVTSQGTRDVEEEPVPQRMSWHQRLRIIASKRRLIPSTIRSLFANARVVLLFNHIIQ